MSIETENRLYKDGWNAAINTVVTALILHASSFDNQELTVEKERLAKLFYGQRM